MESTRSLPAAPDAAGLEAALMAAGVCARVEAEARLALVTAPPDAFADTGGREAAVRLARAHGFTHVALLLTASDV